MDTYYHPQDLGKFADMGKGNKELWDKFSSYYSAVFAEGTLTELRQQNGRNDTSLEDMFIALVDTEAAAA